MAQHILGINTNRRSIGSEVYQGTARTTLSLGEHAVGQCQWSKVHLCHIDLGSLETLVQVLVECLALQDIQEVSFDTRTLYTNGIELIL